MALSDKTKILLAAGVIVVAAEGRRNLEHPGSAHPYASHRLTQNRMASRNDHVSRRTRQGSYPDRAHRARRREVERTLPNEYCWAGNG
jgi:hypothetical protein